MEAINGSVAELIPSVKLEVVGNDDEWSIRDGNGNSLVFWDGISIPTNSDNPIASASEVSARKSLCDHRRNIQPLILVQAHPWRMQEDARATVWARETFGELW